MVRPCEVLIGPWCAALMFSAVAAATAAELQPQVSYPQRHDTSQPLRASALGVPSSERGRVVEFPPPRPNPAIPPVKRIVPDVVRQIPQPAGLAPNMPSPIVSFEGISAAGEEPILGYRGFPPDTNGDVGPNHYVQMVNATIAVYSKSGQLLVGPMNYKNLWSGFGGNCASQDSTDPIVLYDHLADRWLVTSITLQTPYLLCIAISVTGDPTGAYHRYAYEASDFPDYPKYGVWPDAYYLSTSLPDAVAAFDRAEMLHGRTAQMISFRPTAGFALLPADLDGPPPPIGTPNPYLSLGIDELLLWEFHVDFSNPTHSTFDGPIRIPTAAFIYFFFMHITAWNHILP